MSDRHLKRALFADLELTCWEGTPPPGEFPEIIQIGIVEIDLETGNLTRTFDRLVKPVASRLSPYCTGLTGITPKMLKAGRPFTEVATSSSRIFGSAPWMSWGDDATALRLESLRHQCPSPLGGSNIDLSLIFHQLFGLQKKVSLTQALGLLGLPFSGCAHNALNDAINTARLYCAMSTCFRGMLMENTAA